MAEIFRYTTTNLSKVSKLLDLVNSVYYLAVGKDTAWNSSWGNDVSEENPPFPETNLINIPDIKLYKKPIYQTLATESQCGEINFDSCGETIFNETKLTLINLETTTREALNIINPSYLYFRIFLNNSDLNFANINSYRSVGLYKEVTFTSEGQIRYLPTTVVNSGILYWASYFTPIVKGNVNKINTFQIIIKV